MEKDLENHVAGSSAQSANLSSTATKWIKSLGPGRFTCGAKYVCFLPKDGGELNYKNLAVAPDGEVESPQWIAFAECVTEYLNAARIALDNEERGVSDSTPQSAQRGSPNTSGAA